MTRKDFRTGSLSYALCASLVVPVMLLCNGAHARELMPARLAVPALGSVWGWCVCVGGLLLVAWICWLAHRRRVAYEEQYSRRLETEVVNRTRELALRNGELELANRRLEEASLSDPLTGLGNRRSLMNVMSMMVAASEETSPDQVSMILMLIDIDRFKLINDEHGHEAGDRLLERVSSILMECARRTDRVVRWGGDEFVLACRSITFDQAATLAERIRSSVSRCRIQISRAHVARTSCSIGFACYPFIRESPEALSWEQVLKLADMALYSAKSTRNNWVGWCGTTLAAREPDLLSVVEADPAGAVSNGLLDVRRMSASSDIKPCADSNSRASRV